MVFQDLNTVLDINSDWKTLCKKGFEIRSNWLNLSGIFLTFQESLFLYKELIGNLKNPIIPFPALRRDMQSFPTILQDLLGNPGDQFEGDFDYEEYVNAFAGALDDKKDAMYSEIDSISDLNLLTAFRWNISNIDVPEERLSMESLSTDLSDVEIYGKTQTHCILLRIFETILETVQFFCDGSANTISESPDIAFEYSRR